MSFIKPVFKLRDWIDVSKLDNYGLSINPNAIEFLKNNPKKIVWSLLSSNSNAMELLMKHPKNINWYEFSTNPEAIEYLRKHPKKIVWFKLSSNPRGTELLKLNQEKKKEIDKNYLSYYTTDIDFLRNNKEFICLHDLCYNEYATDLLLENIELIRGDSVKLLHPHLIDYIEIDIPNLSDIDWFYLSANSSNKALKILKENQDKIRWSQLSSNTNPEAIELLKANPENIDWFRLCSNKSAIELLEMNRDKINYNEFSSNPAIFQLDYKVMKIKNEEFEEELIKEIMKPSRIFKMIDEYGENYLELLFD